MKNNFLIVVVMLFVSASSFSHEADQGVGQLAREWLATFDGEDKVNIHYAYTSPKRFDFTWLPRRRAGLRLDALSQVQRAGLKRILNTVLSEAGSLKIDAIIATEAALAHLTKAPEYRNPENYVTALFGSPGSERWALRFEGHHLSVNLSFNKDRLVSATPLFLGANPETIPSGPDKGLRALRLEIDLAKQLFNSLSAKQQDAARASDEWFSGFLSSPGKRRASLGKPIGIPVTEFNTQQAGNLRALIAAYVGTLNHDFEYDYFADAVEGSWPELRFYWQGSSGSSGEYYYRIAGGSLLIELETQGRDSHVHAIWRDTQHDFGEK